jgi:hypothetical protein
MIQVNRNIRLVPRLQPIDLAVRHPPGAAAHSSARPLVFHWHLDPLTRRPTMHWVLGGSRAARCLGVAR